jgi:negative regulator of sigma E activity
LYVEDVHNKPILGKNILRSTQTSTQTNAAALGESVSALMDDAAQPLELQRVLKASQDDEQVRQQWARYQLASAALKRQATSASMHLDLADSVRDALTTEITFNLPKAAPSRSKLSQFWQPMAGLAVAASVTVVMVLGAQRVAMTAQTDMLPVQQQGVVLLEPSNSNDYIQLVSTNAAKISPSEQHLSQIIRLPVPAEAINAAEARWLVQALPAGFVLTQRSLDKAGKVAREVLTYSNGSLSFTLYVEALNGRSIAEGHAYAGSNLVFGQSMQTGDSEVFMTLVGELSLAQAEQVASSVVSLKAQ